MSLLSVTLWIARTVLGLGITAFAAVLAYGGMSLAVWQSANWAAASLPIWAYVNLAPSIFLALASAFLIRIRLRTLAMGALLASVFVLLFGAPESPPDAIWSVSSGFSSIAAPILN